jgi:hypothetical protein
MDDTWLINQAKAITQCPENLWLNFVRVINDSDN